MKQLPDILTSAGFWASIATLWGAAGAWGAFIAERSAAHKETEEGVRNLIAGIEAELDLVEGWASGKEGEVGYLTSAKDTELAQKYPQWYDPSFHVFTFATPTLNNFTNSPHVSLLKDIVKPIVRLNYSVRRMFDAIERHRSFAHGNPDLFLIVAEKISTANISGELSGKNFTDGELKYINMIFSMNRGLHQTLIGGIESKDDYCLYRAFRIARNAVNEFKTSFRREKNPGWYVILHALAILFFVNGLWQVLRWFSDFYCWRG